MNEKEMRELEADLARWADDGGAAGPELTGEATATGLASGESRAHRAGPVPAPASPPGGRRAHPAEVAAVTAAVVLAHLLPLSGAAGYRMFAAEGCRSIALVFAVLSAFLLTVRVAIQENARMGALIRQARAPRLWVVEAIGAALLLAWLCPFYVAAHGGAETSIAALGIGISILASAAVRGPSSRLRLGHDLASVLVLAFAFGWVCALPHFNDSEHGEEFLGTVAIGSSSLHSIRTMVETLGSGGIRGAAARLIARRRVP